MIISIKDFLMKVKKEIELTVNISKQSTSLLNKLITRARITSFRQVTNFKG